MLVRGRWWRLSNCFQIIDHIFCHQLHSSDLFTWLLRPHSDTKSFVVGCNLNLQCHSLIYLFLFVFIICAICLWYCAAYAHFPQAYAGHRTFPPPRFLLLFLFFFSFLTNPASSLFPSFLWTVFPLLSCHIDLHDFIHLYKIYEPQVREKSLWIYLWKCLGLFSQYNHLHLHPFSWEWHISVPLCESKASNCVCADSSFVYALITKSLWTAISPSSSSTL